MSAPNDGGPAFPGYSHTSNGMSLRDWFAGMALPGLLAHHDQDYAPLCDNALKSVPESAYKIADAMLREREQEEAQL